VCQISETAYRHSAETADVKLQDLTELKIGNRKIR
jgi:hypothetical protein